MRAAPVVFALTVAGTAALQLASWWLEPPDVPLGDVAVHEGARVRVAGQVLRPREAPWGTTFDLEDGVARLPVLARVAPPPSGAWATVEGIVVRWHGTAALDAAEVVVAFAG
ncbi:MAG TPA: hypothetical protein VI997_04705 [Candidatus Thermoplasmatota archaeon]|nr:hypothetical protein [Candidatus Thermoplasmatota archaeon]